MSESRRLTRMPVYDLSTGRVVGRVHRVVVDPSAKRVAGFLLGAPVLWSTQRSLAFADVHAVGEDAITVRDAGRIVPLSDNPHLKELMRTRVRVYHTPVLTEGGKFLGEVEEFSVDPASGRIAAFRVSDGLLRDLVHGHALLPADVVLTLGEHAIIVRQEAVELLARRRTGRAQPQGSPAAAGDSKEAESLWEKTAGRARHLIGGLGERVAQTSEAGRQRLAAGTRALRQAGGKVTGVLVTADAPGEPARSSGQPAPGDEASDVEQGTEQDGTRKPTAASPSDPGPG